MQTKGIFGTHCIKLLKVLISKIMINSLTRCLSVLPANNQDALNVLVNKKISVLDGVYK